MSAPRGRPSTYNAEIAEKICEHVASGMTLREACRQDGMPPESTVRLWVLDNREGFAARYARARDLLLEHWADETIEIADDGSNDWMTRNEVEVANGDHISRSRLRVDQRKWLLSKLKPERYGDRVVHAGDAENPISVKHAGAKEILAKAVAR
ncbi:MAG: terminase small subunit protein [Rhizobiaceae bacterium]